MYAPRVVQYMISNVLYSPGPYRNGVSVYIFTARKQSLGQDNIFTSVCHSVHRGACMAKGTCMTKGACMVKGGMCGKGGHAW